MSEWITDRLPTINDCWMNSECVFIKTDDHWAFAELPPNFGYVAVHYHEVKPNQPWTHFPRPRKKP